VSVSYYKHHTKRRSNATHSDKVHLVGTPEGRAHVHGPADPEGKKDRDVDVRCEEVLRIPHEEDLVAVDEDEDRRPEGTPYSQTRLQRIPVRELGTIKALYFVTMPWKEISVRKQQQEIQKQKQKKAYRIGCRSD
jgi:hypothetical protein